jgi:hypothetical protein
MRSVGRPIMVTPPVAEVQVAGTPENFAAQFTLAVKLFCFSEQLDRYVGV